MTRCFFHEVRARANTAMLDTADCCLITSCYPQYGVDYAHLLPRAMMGSVVSSHRSKFIL
jgi:hypothetical protein